MENPFLITGYESDEYFCDRDKETKYILNSIENNRNLTLISIRRMGKTGLIHHVFHQLKPQKDIYCFYMDLLPTTSLADLIRLLGKSVIGKMDSKPERLIRKVGSFFSNVRPSISFDPLTGEPSVEFELQNESKAEQTLDQIFDYLKNQDKKIVVALDEFQQILQYPEKNVEAILRANVQKCSEVCFIFSGSHKHMLGEMFTNHGRPFYQSTDILNLDSIDKEAYGHFAEAKFAAGKRKIAREDIDFALGWTRRHTWYTQFVFNKLYSTGSKNISSQRVHETLLEILTNFEVIYFGYRKILTQFQWKLLRAIACEDAVKQPGSKDFIQKYGLGASSSVQSALKSLKDYEMVYETEDGIRIYDLFFSKWLARL